MNRDTWADPGVRSLLKDHFIPVYVDQDSRPDISQRYERWGWPATIIFGPDGTGDRQAARVLLAAIFMPVLAETVKDPFRSITAPAAARAARAGTGLTEAQRAEILGFIDQAWDAVNGGWSKSKLVDGRR